MQAVENGNTVKVHYTGKFENGDTFDSSLEREPLEFVVGAQHVIPGFDNAMVGMTIGEKKSVVCPPNMAYGERDDNLIFDIVNKDLPENFEPKVGMPLELANDKGETLIASIVNVSDDGISLDANHPLSGKELTFEIELLEIK